MFLAANASVHKNYFAALNKLSKLLNGEIVFGQCLAAKGCDFLATSLCRMYILKQVNLK